MVKSFEEFLYEQSKTLFNGLQLKSILGNSKLGKVLNSYNNTTHLKFKDKIEDTSYSVKITSSDGKYGIFVLLVSEDSSFKFKLTINRIIDQHEYPSNDIVIHGTDQLENKDTFTMKTLLNDLVKGDYKYFKNKHLKNLI